MPPSKLTCTVCNASVTISEDSSVIVCPGCGRVFNRRLRPAPGATSSPNVAASRAEPDASHFGRFQLRRKLGEGAFGTVYLAHDPRLDRDVALKVPNPGTLADPKRVERFLREARAAANLNHPNIVALFETGQHEGTYYIASAYIEGQPLSEAIPADGLDPRQAARIVGDLADAVAYAHEQGIVHRDIKPDNILLDANGRPHLLDFGLAARADEAEKLTHDGAVLGTLEYMAPEQAAGQKGDAQPAGDQYSLGIVLYELLTGRPPFQGSPSAVLAQIFEGKIPPPRSLRANIPRDLETICMKCLSHNPDERYATCVLLASDLRRWLAGLPIRARRLSPWEQVLRWVKNSVLVVSMVIAMVLVGMGSLSLASYYNAQASAEVERFQRESARREKAETRAKAEVARADEAARQANEAAAQAGRHEASVRVAEERIKKADEERAGLEALP